MSERHAGYVVTLTNDLNDEDAQQVLDALRMIKGVLSVEPVTASIDVHIGTERARSEIRGKLLDLARNL
ncbi:hypothetical protein ACH4A8_38765 [Streptomyces vietnamensis]|uniref:hypothetical protein n=1 Tax=Streptomyces vietnamensis TaxID=362257 RepID=UPI00379A6A3C